MKNTSRGAREALEILNRHRLPARLNVAQTAVVLGFQTHDIPVLIAGKLLAPLGKPVANAPKYFAAVQIAALSQNEAWLERATKSIADRWRSKNSRALKSHTQTGKEIQ